MIGRSCHLGLDQGFDPFPVRIMVVPDLELPGEVRDDLLSKSELFFSRDPDGGKDLDLPRIGHLIRIMEGGEDQGILVLPDQHGILLGPERDPADTCPSHRAEGLPEEGIGISRPVGEQEVGPVIIDRVDRENIDEPVDPDPPV